MKNKLRAILQFLRLDLTKNLEYDRLTTKIIKRLLQNKSNCIDVGAHKGEVLEIILKYAPEGNHFAFEPIPAYKKTLENRFGNQVNIMGTALSDKNETATFQYVKNAPAYSGIKPRRYEIDNPEIEEIKIETKTLDQVIPENTKIDFIKIDVEGGEYEVLTGSDSLIIRDRPWIIFECGKGGIDFYGHTPDEMFDFFTNKKYEIFTLRYWLQDHSPLAKDEFIEHFENGTEYYFFAASKTHNASK